MTNIEAAREVLEQFENYGTLNLALIEIAETENGLTDPAGLALKTVAEKYMNNQGFDFGALKPFSRYA
jgi:hypothetical protein